MNTFFWTCDMPRSRLLLFIIIMIFVTLPLSEGWSEEGVFIRDGRFSIELKALSLDAVDAFFLARGFDATAAKLISENGCVHKFAAAYDGDIKEKAVAVDLTTWRVRSAGGPWKQLAFKETWAQFMDKLEVSKPAQIAFHWAIFPTHQTFHQGDRMWGMVPMDFMPGTIFDLQAVWLVGEKSSETILTNLQCASPRTGS
ncbi:MAG: hypothetical protein HQL94_11725 [Magnetococcales bacterium]|nr:hypothetical protein [Magnetococcales bacterium]